MGSQKNRSKPKQSVKTWTPKEKQREVDEVLAASASDPGELWSNKPPFRTTLRPNPADMIAHLEYWLQRRHAEEARLPRGVRAYDAKVSRSLWKRIKSCACLKDLLKGAVTEEKMALVLLLERFHRREVLPHPTASPPTSPKEKVKRREERQGFANQRRSLERIRKRIAKLPVKAQFLPAEERKLMKQILARAARRITKELKRRPPKTITVRIQSLEGDDQIVRFKNDPAPQRGRPRVEGGPVDLFNLESALLADFVRATAKPRPSRWRIMFELLRHFHPSQFQSAAVEHVLNALRVRVENFIHNHPDDLTRHKQYYLTDARHILSATR